LFLGKHRKREKKIKKQTSKEYPSCDKKVNLPIPLDEVVFSFASQGIFPFWGGLFTVD
jgi:hypothetical protein